MHLPMPRKPADSALGGMVIVVMITVVMPSLYHIQASQEEPGARRVVPEAARPAPEDKKAREAFLETYRLAPGQNLKLIPPPRPEGLHAWAGKNAWRVGPRDDLRAIAFGWRDPDQLKPRSVIIGGSDGWVVRELPDLMRMDIGPLEIEGDADLLKMRVRGDWVAREGVPAEQLITPLEAILQRALRQRIALAIRRIERDVVVARGRYRHSPLPGHVEGKIEVYAREFDPTGNSISGTGSFPRFLESVGEWIGRSVVNEVESSPKHIVWHHNERDPSTEQTRREDRDEAMVLKHLQEQTGLTFTREKRPMRILFVERPKSPQKP
jgi:hypothetical protein